MKKIKQVLTLLLLLACLFSLVSCSESSGEYVQDSLSYNSTYLSSLRKVSTTVEFEVYLADAEKYEITYTLELYYGVSKIAEETFHETRLSSGDEKATIYEYWSVDYTGSNVKDYNFVVKLTDVSAKAYTVSGTSYEGLSIGFGVVGGVLLIGLIALYIYLNKRNKKANAA